ncbi:MAG: B12-binding domain/radical SAM domain-containing protein [Patescibacteria group bacterium]|jgi:B12-binding domain/radical SAM domain protein
MGLRVVAVSAPAYFEGRNGSALNSKDPASLFNACRRAAYLANTQSGPWGNSNWTVPRIRRRENLLLMYSAKEDMPEFEKLLEREKPNLLLIGAMTLCLPGAVACAERAKQMFGDNICVVLGGKHVNETVYQDYRSGKILHHPGSPLRLMSEHRIKPVFDLIVSGEAEYVIAKIGEAVDSLDIHGVSVVKAKDYLCDFSSVPGRWIIGWLNGDSVSTINNDIRLDRDLLPIPSEMFGVRTKFSVFPGRLTAHVFSDSGSGCIYDCNVCSESSSVAGFPVQTSTSAQRLYKQLECAAQMISSDSPGHKASAFVEDSILLGGSQASLNRLLGMLQNKPLDLVFGGQFTIDQALNKMPILQELYQVSMNYIFIGLETEQPSLIGGMSKDHTSATTEWLDRAEKLLYQLSRIGYSCGASLLFGLGESRASRQRLFNRLNKWQQAFGMPKPISLNWAVQHPLKGNDNGANYSYLEWGTPSGPLLRAFKDFGEASLRYPIFGQKPPTLEEVEEVLAMNRALSE